MYRAPASPIAQRLRPCRRPGTKRKAASPTTSASESTSSTGTCFRTVPLNAKKVPTEKTGEDQPDDHSEDHKRAEDPHHQGTWFPAGHRDIRSGQLAATSWRGLAPKRRTRDPYSASAALRSSGPKSGHSVSVTTISA